MVFELEVCNQDPENFPIVNFYFGPATGFASQFWTDPQGPAESSFQIFGQNDAYAIGSMTIFETPGFGSCPIIEISYMSTTFGPTTADFFNFSAWNGGSDECQSVFTNLGTCGSQTNCTPCQSNLCNEVCGESFVQMTTNAGATKGFVSNNQDNTMTAMFTNQINGFAAGNTPDDCNNVANYSIIEDLLVDIDWCVGEVGSRRTISIHEGKKIIIPAGVTVTWEDVEITSCLDIFWDAIVVQDGGKLFIKNCDIDNGANAIRVERGGLLDIESCNFIDNHVGIFLDGNEGAGPFDLRLRGNTFRGTGNLAMPYAGQSPLPDDLPYAGIQLRNVDFANLAPAGSGSDMGNTYDNMYNGIVSQNSSFVISKAEFSNMLRPSDFNDGDIAGYGIYAANKGSNYRFIQVRRNLKLTTFENMPTAIYLRNVSADVEAPTITQVEQGIIVKDCVKRNVTISDCFINASKFGIKSTNNSPHTGTMVDNIIYIDSPTTNSTPFTESAGILCDENALTREEGWVIENNRIDIIKADAAIVYDHGSNARIIGNELNRFGSRVFSYNLLELGASPGSLVSCNILNSSRDNNDVFSDSRGMKIVSSSNLEVSCNDISNLEEGVMFSGVCERSDFRANSMNNGFVGLKIAADGVISPQDNKGNCFNENESKEAVHGAQNVAFVQASLFTVKCGQDNNGLSCICPDPDDIETGTGDPVHFFNQSSIGITATCEGEDGENSCEDKPGFTNPDEPNDEISISLARGGGVYADNQGQYERMMQYSLFDILNNQEVDIKSPELLKFYEAQANSLGIISKVANFNSDIENHEVLHEDLMQAIEALEALEEAFYNGIITESVYEMSRGQLTEHVLVISGKLNAKESTFQNELAEEISSQEALLAQLPENGVYETNMKYILSHVLDARHPDFDGFTQLEWDLIYSLALQCAKDAGHAVFWARSLYNASHDWIDFSELEICNSLESRSSNISELQELGTKVFPNPSTGLFTFYWPIDREAEVKIVDIQGRLHLTRTITQGENTIDLNGAPLGVYLYTILGDEHSEYKGKIILVK